ncbi:MAG TPA: hypothetical protein VNK43_08950 [Gemmatimonadales bacterium]|nr:hypothetical protein [Gemmatimonadales bacterium]
MRRWALLLVLGLMVAVGPSAAGQSPTLDRAAEVARRAWRSHDIEALVASSPRLLLQLPGADPSAALGRSQAAALLRDYVKGAEELETAVAAAQEVQAGRGYVELVRRYRLRGTREVRIETLLLSFRLEPAGWVLTELRVAG